MLIPKQAVRKLAAYSKPPEGRLDYLRLDFNENTRGASPAVLDALRRISAEECGCYPEYGAFKSVLARDLGVEAGMVLPTNGSDEALKVIFDTFVEKGDRVLLFKPSFPLFEVYATLAEAQQVIIPLEESEDFAYPVDRILDSITSDTKMLVIALPNNPTGTGMARSDLIQIIERNPRMAVVIDEAYAPFAKDSMLDLAQQYPNVLVTQTFSKGFGLAGLRIGYVVSQTANIENLARVISPYSVNRFAVAAAMAALKDSSYLDQYVDEVALARKLFLNKMQALGFKMYPTQANFVLVDCGADTARIQERMRKAKILVREKEGLLRFTIGTLAQTQRLLEALEPPRQALIFDMDGVLVDESQSYRLCIQHTVEKFSGQSVSVEAIAQAKSASGSNDDYDCVVTLLRKRGVAVAREEIMLCFDAYYEKAKCNERWLIDTALLKSLKEQYRLGIFTGRPKRDALDALQRFNASALFDVVVTRDDVQNGKPDPEGLFMALRLLNASRAIYIGDHPDDARAAEQADCPFIKVSPATTVEVLLAEISRLRGISKRSAEIQRLTLETQIQLRLNVDGKGQASICTGIGFFDHLLEAMAKHGSFDVNIACQGDLHVDQHHTVEDVGIALGEAFALALKDKRGLARTGYFVFPMDESLAICAIDFSNRPHLAYQVEMAETTIGAFETVNLPNFFSGFVKGAQVNLHLQVPYGSDPHHKAEALFKAFGKALNMACSID